MNRDNTSVLPASAVKKIITQQVATRLPSETKLGDAHTFRLMPTDQVTMEQILAEIKFIAAWENDVDESVGARLDTIDSALKQIKEYVTSVEGCPSAVEEAEERITATEEMHSCYLFILTECV